MTIKRTIPMNHAHVVIAMLIFSNLFSAFRIEYVQLQSAAENVKHERNISELAQLKILNLEQKSRIVELEQEVDRLRAELARAQGELEVQP